ncbi:hypothetical protein CCACVL1_10021 [Corchorus capsularis]|uniref:Uncharacterized protein n=1 Tax=Corchorus capsularis TaxID=210143 RepID=A0A1R3IT49_COCAP|nr:hypothetical protein CCACVL1_10021 [Corchorus capsularis]
MGKSSEREESSGRSGKSVG